MSPKYSDRSVIIEVAQILVALVVGRPATAHDAGTILVIQDRSRTAVENLALRNQLGVLRRSGAEPAKIDAG